MQVTDALYKSIIAGLVVFVILLLVNTFFYDQKHSALKKEYHDYKESITQQIVTDKEVQVQKEIVTAKTIQELKDKAIIVESEHQVEIQNLHTRYQQELNKVPQCKVYKSKSTKTVKKEESPDRYVITYQDTSESLEPRSNLPLAEPTFT